MQYFREHGSLKGFLGFQQMFLFGLAKLGLIVGPILLGFLAVGFFSQAMQVFASSEPLPKFSRSTHWKAL